jgi:ribulose-5-phosphate 4-epimerase/fuculose-1-phosphate aldolase
LSEWRDVLFLANHGVIVCGEDRLAFDDLYYLERAHAQVLAQGTGKAPPAAHDRRGDREAACGRAAAVGSLLPRWRILDREEAGWSALD